MFHYCELRISNVPSFASTPPTAWISNVRIDSRARVFRLFSHNDSIQPSYNNGMLNTMNGMDYVLSLMRSLEIT